MPELSDLQGELLEVIKANSQKQKELFANHICKLSTPELIEKMTIKPKQENYVSKMLKRLQEKGKVRVSHKYIVGEGQKRIIEILSEK